MNSEFTSYLESVGIKKDSKMFARIDSPYSTAQFLCPEDKIIDVFVCESTDQEGRRAHHNVLFFSMNYVMECKQLKPDTDDAIDICGVAAFIRDSSTKPISMISVPATG